MITALRYVDSLLGKVLCYILKTRLQRKHQQDYSNTTIQKILLIRLRGMGNLTLIWPLIYRIKKHYPNALIFFLTFDINRGFLERNQAIEKIIYFKFKENIIRIQFQFISALKIFKKEKIDVVVNFETLNNI